MIVFFFGYLKIYNTESNLKITYHMKTIDELKNQLQTASAIEDKIAIRILIIELSRKLKDLNFSISPISDLQARIHKDKKLAF